MAIPLPALDIKTPQQPDLMQQYGNLMRLKAMQGQIAEQPLREQALQQQLQTGATQQQAAQLRLQQEQQAAKDQQAVQQTLAQNPGKTIGDILPQLRGKVSVPTFQGLVNTDFKLRQNAASLNAAQLANQKTAYGDLQGIYNSVQGMQPDQLAASWPQLTTQINGIAKTGGLGFALDPAKPMTLQQLDSYAPMLQLHDAYLDSALKRRKAIADATTAEQNATFGPSGPAADAKYRFLLTKKASGQSLTPAEMAWGRGYEASKAKATTQSDTLGVTSYNVNRPAGLSQVGAGGGRAGQNGGTSGDVSTGGSLNPGRIKGDIVDMIGNYDEDPSKISRIFYKHPEIQGLVHERYPNWSEPEYAARNKMVQSYTSGPESKTINSIGTALGHANELRDAIDALGNGDHGINALRAIGQKIGVQVGDDPVTAFNLIVHRVAPEITQAYVQGGGGEGERAANAEDFKPSMSRQQLLKNWAKTVKLLFSKSAQQKQQWDTTMQPTRPENQFYTRFFSPVAREAIQRWENETGNSGPTNAGPSVGTVEGGYRFKGGNPADKNNWVPVQ